MAMFKSGNGGPAGPQPEAREAFDPRPSNEGIENAPVSRHVHGSAPISPPEEAPLESGNSLGTPSKHILAQEAFMPAETAPTESGSPLGTPDRHIK
jgi:hypothetical protein